MTDTNPLHPPRRQHSWLIRLLALASVGGPLLFVTAYLVAGALRPGYSPVHQVISDLGVGSDAWLLNASTILAGALLMSFAFGFAFVMSDVMTPGWRWLCGGLLALHGLGLVVAGVFTEAPATLAIHWLVGADLGFFGPVVAFLVVGLRWLQHTRWHGWARYTLLMALVTLLVIAATFWIFTPGTPLASLRLGGLMERVLLLTIQSWYVVVGWWLFATGGAERNSVRTTEGMAIQSPEPWATGKDFASHPNSQGGS